MSVRWPDAEIEVNASLVEELVRRQHPDLAERPVLEMSPGFDNTIWRLGHALVVRLPRRQVAVPLLISEHKWLPELAPWLPLLIPTPLRVGRPSELFPWPWTITRWIEGTPGNEVDATARARAATPLGEFLRALHFDAPEGAPSNPFRDVPLSVHDASFRGRLDEIGGPLARDKLRRIWLHAQEVEAWGRPPQWIHGDPHPANLIFRDGELVGVIDFGDLCAGDPATDLAGGFLSLPLEAIGDFLRAYGGVSDATLWRTLGWAVHFGVLFILLGESDDPTYGPLGHLAVDNAVAFSEWLK
jgi:aminoglycoside phosphotransferase (APT) family kinase protein